APRTADAVRVPLRTAGRVVALEPAPGLRRRTGRVRRPVPGECALALDAAVGRAARTPRRAGPRRDPLSDPGAEDGGRVRGRPVDPGGQAGLLPARGRPLHRPGYAAPPPGGARIPPRGPRGLDYRVPGPEDAGPVRAAPVGGRRGIRRFRAAFPPAGGPGPGA